MEPILKTLAREYSHRYKNIKSFCFVFPNKRCGIFIKKYYAQFGINNESLPHILTISEFTSQIAKKSEAKRIEQLFVLYNAYIEILREQGQKEIDFETFRGWGETVLSDFNTVDMALADPKELFKNVNDYKEISTDFLSEEQKEVMREYFGIETNVSPISFWNHLHNTEKSDLKKRFLNLWQILYPLYVKFNRTLSDRGLASSGNIYRRAANRVKERGRSILPYSKVIFIGFNALTEAERIIFKSLKDESINEEGESFVDFIWDIYGPILNNPHFSASRFVSYNKKHFPMPVWLETILQNNSNTNYPDIHIISAPSLTSQTKIAGLILEKYKDEKNKGIIADSEVAVVLPDETLLPNILFSLPENIGDVNLTMGYSLKQSSISSFMSLLRRLYSGSREKDNNLLFLAKDLKLFFTHPFSRLLVEDNEIESLSEFIQTSHKVTISEDNLREIIPGFLKIVEFPSKKLKDDSIFLCIEKILSYLMSKLLEQEEESIGDWSEIDQVQIYKEYVESLKETTEQYNVHLAPLTMMQMIEKLISAEKIGFEGEPLYGLQVMGTLESRSLDFKHVIIMSMNEGIMPRKTFNNTFIPDTLRRVYGLPPARYAEEIFGYYFYRLLSRAEKVSLIYDGRTISGLRGGESRYLLQLKQYLPKEKIVEESWQYSLQSNKVSQIKILKNEDILEKLSAFSIPNEKRKNFSASSLNSYRECQIKFFLQSVLDINSDPDRGDYMDPIVIGIIFHDVMMELYLRGEKKGEFLKTPILIDRGYLENLLTDNLKINRIILKYINAKYYSNTTSPLTPLESGVTEILASQIKELVYATLNYDLKFTPFYINGCEISRKINFKLTSGRNINFNFAIDRLDEIEVEGEKRIRIVDYKTGTKKRQAKNIDEVFEGGYKSEQIFQLFTYAWLLGKIGYKGWEDVMTEIYYVPDLIKGEAGLPEIDKHKITSFRPYIEDFSKRIENMIESIFSSPYFIETADTDQCEFCSFKTFCNK